MGGNATPASESLSLDPRNPIILSEAALTSRALRRFEEAHALVDRAREIEPQNEKLIAQKAEMFLAQGDTTKADQLLNAVPVDGRDPIVATGRVRLWLMLRQYPEAIRALKNVLEGPGDFRARFPMLAANYRAELAIAEALAGHSDARVGLEEAREGLTAIRAEGGDQIWTANTLILVSGLLHDKATVEAVAAEQRDRIEHDAMSGPSVQEAIAIARAHLGEPEAALKRVKELLQKPGENSLTPALLRADPFWDPLRNDPRFRELSEAKP